jgi:hypothetical protein
MGTSSSGQPDATERTKDALFELDTTFVAQVQADFSQSRPFLLFKEKCKHSSLIESDGTRGSDVAKGTHRRS